MVKRTVKTIGYTFFILFITVVTIAYLVLNSLFFQNWLTARVTDYLSAKFKTNITIGHITYHPFTSFSLDDVYWGDQKNDTLFYVEKLTFNLGGFDSDSLKLSLNDVHVKGGYCKIVTYPDHTFNISVLTDIIDKNDTIHDPNAPKFTLYFDQVICSDSRFRLIDSTKKFEPEGFDGFNEDYTDINLIANHFWIIKDSLNFDIRKLSCKERSGAEIKQLTAQTSIAPSGIRLTDLELNTAYSHITDQYSMLYNGWDELADYNNKVNMVANLKDVQADMRDVAFFAPFLKNYHQRFVINGSMRGPVKNLKFKDLDVEFGRLSRFVGDASLKGLPEIEETFIDVKAEDAVTNRIDLEYLIGDILPNELSRLGQMKFKGRYTGFYNDFVAYGHFNTALGSINSDLNMKLPKDVASSSYSGNMELIDFDMGTFTGNRKYVGRTSLTGTVSGKGFTLKDLQADFKSKIRYFHAYGYDYKNIAVNGRLDKKIFEGDLQINDSNAKLDFAGNIDFRSDMAKYTFSAALQKADLKALKFVSSDNTLSANVNIDFAFKDIDNNNGVIEINDILFQKDNEDYPIKQVRVTSQSAGGNKLLRVRSEIAEAEMKGDFNFENMSGNIQNILSSLLPNYIKPSRELVSEEKFSFKMEIGNSDVISDVFYPKLRIYDMNVEGKLSSANKTIEMSGVAANIKYGDFSFKNMAVKSDIHKGESGRILFGVEDVFQKDTSVLKDFAMVSEMSKNEIHNHIKISDSMSLVYADILNDIAFNPGGVAEFTFDKSDITYRKRLFTIDENSLMILNDSQLLCKDIKIINDDSYLLINGFYDFYDTHNLRADAKDIDLSLLNVFLPKLAFRVGGNLDGAFVLKGNNHKNYLNTFVTLNDLSFDGDTLGNYTLTSNYNDKQERFLIYAKSLNGKLRNFEAGGYISTVGDQQVNINVTLSESDIRSFQAFLKDEVLFYGGEVAAKCTITGTISQILINGEVDVTKTDMRVEYLKTRYKLDANIVFDNHNIKITPFYITDEYKKTALVSGNITHNGFSSMNFDVNLTQLRNFQLLNTTAKDNTLFYGTAYGTGSIHLSGPQNALLLETDLTTEKGTVIFIPLMTGSETGETGFINFVDKDTLVKQVVIARNSLSGFELSSVIHATPDAEIQLILNEQTGDIIKGKGKGAIKMELTKEGAFNMYGQVTIEEGEYRFTAANVFTKKFTLSKGGTIDWTGDPMQARLDIKGIYLVRKVSVTEIVPSASTTSGAVDSKVPVECLLFVKGNLSAPEIKFDLNFPDLQNSVGTNNVAEVQNAVRTLRSEPDMMNQQVMSLMLFGKFAPMSSYYTSSTSTFSSGAATTLSDILTAQANGLVGSIIPGLDFNIDYQVGSETSKNRTIVSASKKFYNNRLEVQTSYDPQYTFANVSTQYSIRKDGSLKVKLYNKNTTNIIDKGNVLTQGIGLYYRKEFDTFSELVTKKKKGEAKKAN